MALAGDAADSARENWVGARDWAVLLLLYGCGMRVSEATGLTGDVLPLGQTLRVTGKRNKTRIVPLLDNVREAIEGYLELCPYPPAKGEPLFRGSRGGPLSPALIRRAVQGQSTISPEMTDHLVNAYQSMKHPGDAQTALPSQADPAQRLSPRERQILAEIARGASNKEIALQLNISQQTVKNHMTAILRKLHVDDRTQAAVYALRHGWVRLDTTSSN